MIALTGLFNELDVDKSGSVSVDELMEGLERLGYDITEAGGWRVGRGAALRCAGLGGRAGAAVRWLREGLCFLLAGAVCWSGVQALTVPRSSHAHAPPRAAA